MTENGTDYSRALLFYFDHWDDMAALAELDEHPPDVPETDWAKFQSVDDAARRNVVEILRLLADDLKERFSGDLRFRPYSRDSWIHSYWWLLGELTIGKRATKKIGGLGLALDLDLQTHKPVVALVFWFQRNGRQKASALIERVGDRWAGRLRFAGDEIDSESWNVLLGRWPVPDSSIAELRKSVDAAASRFLELRDEVTSTADVSA